MTDEIRVNVASCGDGRNLMMTYRDPVTGKKVAKSGGSRMGGRTELRPLSVSEQGDLD